MIRRLAAAFMISILVGVAPAEARRPATVSERDAMARAVYFPPACTVAVVSTVNETWGRVNSTNADGCPLGDGYLVLRRSSSVSEDWSVYGESQPADPSASCPDGMPRPVGFDLQLCRRAKTYIGCASTSGEGYEVSPRERPRTCYLLANPQGVGLARLRWRGWGRRVARGRGRIRPGSTRARVRAYRRVRLRSGDYCYTRLKVTTRYGTDRRRLRRCR